MRQPQRTAYLSRSRRRSAGPSTADRIVLDVLDVIAEAGICLRGNLCCLAIILLLSLASLVALDCLLRNAEFKELVLDWRVGKLDAGCGIMIVTSWFSTMDDWQRPWDGVARRQHFRKIQSWYRSVKRFGLNGTIIYDSLPDETVRSYATDSIKFWKVNLSDYSDRKYGVNDIRFFFFLSYLQGHDEVKYVFFTDGFDCVVAKSPCPRVREGVIYAGYERERIANHSWMSARYADMGGKYLDWWCNYLPSKQVILSAGLVGGSRSIMLSFLEKIVMVLQDPNLTVAQTGGDINVDMGAYNYVLLNFFAGKLRGGQPVHSRFKRYETGRRDVWFIHK